MSEDYKNCLKESHVENEISFLSKKYDFVKLIKKLKVLKIW